MRVTINNEKMLWFIKALIAADRNDNNGDYEATSLTKNRMVTVIDMYDN